MVEWYPSQGYTDSVINAVRISKRAQKQVDKAPRHIADKLFVWVRSVKLLGLDETRKVPGWHDEPLKGERQGQRSIRLSRKWRAIYEIIDGDARFVCIEEVMLHDY